MTRAHYLRGNKSEWTPRYVGFFDTETKGTIEGEREIHRLRLWAASVVDRRGSVPSARSVTSCVAVSSRELALWVDSRMGEIPNLWLFAHNLGFDLATSRLVDHLYGLGWRLGDFRFAGRNVSGYMRKNRATVWLVDTGSWWPHGLDTIGAAIGRPKMVRPDETAPESDWFDYCANDVAILAQAVLTLLDWWDRNRLGHFAKTGPQCGWNSLRHRSPPRFMLIDPQPDRNAADRKAIYGGRRDVTRVGPISGGPFALLDFSDSYLNVAANCLLPTERKGYRETFTYGDVYTADHCFGVAADCLVKTDRPRYPLRTQHGVFYPVGTFHTVLGQPEIDWAHRNGDLLDIGAGWVHSLGHPLQRWAGWAIDQVNAPPTVVPAVVRLAVKQWGRSVPGKFGGRTSTVYARGPARWPGWHLEQGTAGPDHVAAQEVHMAGRCWWVVQDQEGENSYPAVLAWIESYVRVALGRMLEALGEDLWVTADTDGCVVDLSKARSWLAEARGRIGTERTPADVAAAVCEAVTAVCWPLVPRVKGMAETLTVAGPQHYSSDTFAKAAGKPGKPEKGADGRVRLWSWPGTAWQMEHGSPDGYVRVEASWTDPATTAHRWVLDDGGCVPPDAAVNPSGVSVITSGRPAPWLSHGRGLAAVQSQAMRHYL